jgi:glycosyltransferase involved in cell wall biosynthesis
VHELVSVVIPTYNYARFVGEAVESALGQTYPSVEVIVVDDGSTDETQDVLRKFGKAIINVRKANQGLSAARNTGIAHAHGAFIAFLDSDDIWLPEKLTRQLALFDGAPTVGLVGCNGFLIRQNGEIFDTLRYEPAIARPKLLRKLLMGNCISGGSNACIRRECLEKVGGFDESLRSAEDWDMWLRIVSHYDVRFASEPLVKVRITENSMSSATNNDRMINNEMVVLDKFFADAGRACSIYAMRKAYAHRYLRAARASMGTNDSASARRYVLKSLKWNPCYLLSTISGVWTLYKAFSSTSKRSSHP